MTDHYSPGWDPQDAAEEAALRADLDQLVAAEQLTEYEAAQILPGYEYPELLLWIRPPLDQLNPPPVSQVRLRGLHLQQHQALHAAIARHEHWHDDHDGLVVDRATTSSHDADAGHTAGT